LTISKEKRGRTKKARVKQPNSTVLLKRANDGAKRLFLLIQLKNPKNLAYFKKKLYLCTWNYKSIREYC